MTPDDENAAAARPRRRRDTQPVLRAAVLVCSADPEATAGHARLREIAWERELFVEIVAFDDTARLVATRPGAVFVMDADEPRARIDRMREACSSQSATLVVATISDERSIRASVDAIEDAIIHRHGPGRPGHADA